MRMSENNASITVNWDLVNFSHLWDHAEHIDLFLEFRALLIDKAVWELWCYPKLVGGVGYVCFNLERMNRFSESTEFDFEIAILSEDGIILKIEKREGIVFSQEFISVIDAILKEEDLLVARKDEFLTLNTLKTRLRMWWRDTKTLDSFEMFATSYAQMEMHSFVWDIDNFSRIQSGQEINHKCKLFFLGGKIVFSLHISENDRGEIEVEILHETNKINEIRNLIIKFYVVNSNGNHLNCGRREVFFAPHENDYYYVLPLSRQNLKDNNDLYLPNDILSLKCEYSINTGILHTKITKVEIRKISSKQVNPSSQTLHTLDSETENPELLDLLNKGSDSLHQKKIYDTILQTKTKSFPANAVMLSARSPVFKSMLIGDLGKTKAYINVFDLDDYTVEQMLLYIYKNTLGYLHWDAAMKLYIAADKYEILSLKRKCSSFLKDNLKVKNVCDALCFADLHHDKDLKRAAQVYILQHANIVMKLTEWRQLMETNSTLAAETMYKNWEKD